MTKQNSLDDVGLDFDGEENDDGFEDAADSAAIEGGFGRDSPRPGTPIPIAGRRF